MDDEPAHSMACPGQSRAAFGRVSRNEPSALMVSSVALRSGFMKSRSISLMLWSIIRVQTGSVVDSPSSCAVHIMTMGTTRPPHGAGRGVPLGFKDAGHGRVLDHAAEDVDCEFDHFLDRLSLCRRPRGPLPRRLRRKNNDVMEVVCPVCRASVHPAVTVEAVLEDEVRRRAFLRRPAVGTLLNRVVAMVERVQIARP